MNTHELTGALRETLGPFENNGEPLTTTEVANRLELGRRATYERLERLTDRDLLETKKVGASARVWWRPSRDGLRDDGIDVSVEVPDEDVNPNGRVDLANSQFESLVEAVEEYAIFTLDPDGYVRSWNAGAKRIKGYAAADIVGEHVSTFYTEADRDAKIPEENLEVAAESGSIQDEGWRVRADGERFWANVTITAIRTDDGTLAGFTKVTRDMTDRREYERRLKTHAERVARQRDDLERELDAVFDRISDGVYGLDEALRLTYANDQARALLDIGDDAVGKYIHNVISSTDKFETTLERARNRQESIVTEEYYEPADGWYEYTVYPSESGLSVYVRDVTVRKERESELHRRVEQHDVIARLGQRALVERDLDSLLHDASRIVAETLGNEYCKVLDLTDDGEELLLREGVGWDEDVVGEATVSATEDNSQAAHTLRTEDVVVVENLDEEDRFSGPALLTDHDVSSGISVVIGPLDDPWGILGVHDTDVRSISDDDATFVRAVAAILAAAITRHDDERALLHQREQLAALNNLNEVVRDITDAVIDQSTRQEIERTVVERLAAVDSYEFAWIGDVDSNTVSMRAEAGVDGYLDGTSISIDSDDERGRGPTGRAFRTGEIQVSQDIYVDDRYGPWLDRAETYDFQSSAAIPIVHEDTVYGVLNVYAGRPNAFTGEEQRVIAQIGEVIGHAIAATERKQALVSDEVVELEFLVPDVLGTVDADVDVEGTITVDHILPRSEGEFLVHGTATADAIESLRSLADEAPDWESVTIRETGPNVRFEARLVQPSILSLVASRGGYVDAAVITDGDLNLTVQLSPHVDVRGFVDAVTDANPSVTLLRRKQHTRVDVSASSDHRPTSELTAQQRTAIETAFHAGYFAWPRLASGEDVADSLDIAPPTFHQHLRKAESKVLETVLSGTA